MTNQDIVTHSNPVWRNKADFIIAAPIQIDSHDEKTKWEQLWTRQMSTDKFEICCIPFFIYNIALGDHVSTISEYDRKYVVDKVVKPASRFVFRLWFQDFSKRSEVELLLKNHGCLMEWRSAESRLMAVDASSMMLSQEVANILECYEQRGTLAYETGKLSTKKISDFFGI